MAGIPSYKLKGLDMPNQLGTEAVNEASINRPVSCVFRRYQFLRLERIAAKVQTMPLPGAKLILASLFLAASAVPALQAQGILTVTPGRGAATVAGTGAVGDSGDNGAATSATLASPRAVAYDSNGNLYLADENNHVIREISKATGTITTIAGTGGIAGYGGDGGAATSAYLDTPTGVAVDSSGNVYIADSHNQRIREVSGGTIKTIAGNGTAGFGGDGGAATTALLALPTGVAVDSSGNVYIADTNNHRIREISAGTINTIAGDGEELYAGDGGAATSAALDSPTGVAVDAGGNVYIADRLNQRIRMVSPGGTIITIAGSGPANFSGGFSGDGSRATLATLAKPSGVSVDANGNIYVADTNNDVVRQVVSGGAIQSIEGTATSQGYGGDNGVATSAILNSPKAAVPDSVGNLSIADTLNERIRSGALPSITFGSAAVGVNSNLQSVTLANTGTVSLTVASIAFTGAFTTASGGSCPAIPITLAASASCTQNLVFIPTAAGASTGSVVFSGTGVVPEDILLSGTGTQSTSTTTLAAVPTIVLADQSTVLTATVTPQGTGTPGSSDRVTFLDGGSPVGSPVPLGGSFPAGAILTTTLPVGNNVMTAVYSGDANFGGSTSNAVTVQVQDFNFNISTTGGGNAQTVEPGKTATFTFNIAPANGPFTFPITLSYSGLPPGATAIFSPSTITLGSSPTTFTLTITTAATARLHRQELFGGGGAVAVAMLLVPFGRRSRRKGRKLRPLFLSLFLLLGLGASVGLTGCGGGPGFFAQSPQSYTITVTGAATSGTTTLQHSTTVTLTVE